TIRQRLAPKITVLDHREVTGLIPAGNPSQYQNVRGIESREARGAEARANATPEPMTADLAADATGRTSRAREWLVRLVYPFPKETRVDPLLGYASRFYAIPPGFEED